ncbi:MAG: helix-turn-helix domain-containing protein [Thiohalomonadaceae bacterium]
MKKSQNHKKSEDMEVYYTTREAAQMLHVSLRTVQLWVEAGVLKAWKTDGGHRRVPHSSVQALIKQRMGEMASVESIKKEDYSVLVLEDDEDMLQLYKLTLPGWNLPVNYHFVSSVYEALVEIGRRPPDLLITDLRMSGVDGFEIIKVLRADPVLSALNVIVVSGLEPHEIEERGGLPPDITVFPKPLSFELLQGYVSACLAQRTIKERRNAESA